MIIKENGKAQIKCVRILSAVFPRVKNWPFLVDYYNVSPCNPPCIPRKPDEIPQPGVLRAAFVNTLKIAAHVPGQLYLVSLGDD